MTAHVASITLAAITLTAALGACRPASGPASASPGPAAPENTPTSDPSAPDPSPEAQSLFGRPLHPPPLAEDVRRTRQAQLAEAVAAYEADPTDLEAIVAYGRRLAYLGRYREAIAAFGDGLRIHPDSPRLLRHRGHRFITLRRFDHAVADLERAAHLMIGQDDREEEDGLPNSAGVTTSSLHTNVWYHLALAHYLRGDFARASEAWDACYDASTSDDMRVAATYWLVLALRRRGDAEAADAALARVPAEPVLRENFSYARLLQLYRGEIDLRDAVGEASTETGDATLGYGVARWLEDHGDAARARAYLERVVRSPQWAAFGHIAAEVDLFGMR